MSLFSFFTNAFILVALAYEARTMFGLWSTQRSILLALKECPIRDRSLYPHAQFVSLMNEGLIEPYGTGYRLT